MVAPAENPMPDTCGPYPIATLVASLKSSKCPACGQPKRQRHSLCYRCYKAVKPETASNLYTPIGSGYGDALKAAFDELQVTEPHFPG